MVTKDDAVPVTAEEAEAIPGDIWAQVDAIAEPFGNTPREYARCVDRLRCALARQLLLARHRGSTAVVDVEALRPLREITALSADPASKRILCLHFSREIGGEHREAILAAVNLAPRDDAALASLSQTPATPMDELQRLGQEYDGAVQEGLREALAEAYRKGATDVHNYWVENPGEPPRGDPEFGEAASDYASAALDIFDSSARALSATTAPPVDETDRLRTERDEAAEHLAAVLFSDPGPKMLASIAAARAWWLEYDKRCESALADRTKEGEVRRG